MSPERVHPHGPRACAHRTTCVPPSSTAIASAVDRALGEPAAGPGTRRSGPPTRRSPRRSPTGSAGWMRPAAFPTRSPSWRRSPSGVREVGYTDVLVCGMGGSSLAPEVLAAVFPALRPRACPSGSSTPPTRRRCGRSEAASDPATTLRIIATKSGTTTETLAFLAHFWESRAHRVGRFHGNRGRRRLRGHHRPGASLEAIPHSDLLPGDVPQPAGRRRSLQRPDLRGPGARRAPGPGPGGAPRGCGRTMLGRCARRRGRTTRAWRWAPPWAPSRSPAATS